MKTAHELLVTAPADQITRCQLAYTAIAKGEWKDAAHYLYNAAKDEQQGNAEWANDAAELAEHCNMLSV